MIWSWLIGSRLGRSISTAALAVTLFLGITAQQRRDARNDALRDAKEKDRDNAESIRDRVRDVPDKLHDYADRGWRD
jgi:3-methyladenine DNA glycosylase AlkD